MRDTTSDPAVALATLRRVRRLLITSHAAPDGDAIGSELALAELAARLGVEATIVNRDPHPANLDFLPGIERIAVSDRLPPPEHIELVAVLECPGLDRPGFEGLERWPILNVDHHLSNERYGAVNYVDEEAPAVGEMVLRLAQAAGVSLTPTMATNLYVALVTDTGDFRYSNTTPRAFHAAAQLVAAGAVPHRIAEALWEQVPPRLVRLQALVLATLQLEAGGRLATITCDAAMLAQAGAFPQDTENLINVPRAIAGVRVAAFFKAFSPGSVKVSLRSRGDVDVQAVARTFGGGGHTNAAGCTVPGTLPEVQAKLRQALLPLVEVP